MYWTENFQILIYGRQMTGILSKPIEKSEYHDIPKLKSYMIRVMALAAGAGLAAPQIGCFKQLVVFEHRGAMVDLVNPYITQMCGKEMLAYEGCLSLPPMENQCLVPRLETVHVEASTVDDPARREFVFSNFAARVVQHEIDHLTGTFFVDRVKSQVRQEVLERFEEWKALKRATLRKGKYARTRPEPFNSAPAYLS